MNGQGMTMTNGSIALALAAGMVAVFNPCGFALLPAYIGTFISDDKASQTDGRRVHLPIKVAVAVSLGLVVVFSTVGLIIDSIATGARRRLPWVTIVISALLLIAGLAMATGWNPLVTVREPRFSGQSGSVGGVVGYGVTYAVASLSFAIEPFLAITVATSPIVGFGAYLSYAKGTGIIILVIGVGSAFAHTVTTERLRRLSAVAPRVRGLLTATVGAYAIWYGRWELAVYGGDAIKRVGAAPLAVTTLLATTASRKTERLASNT